MAIPNKSQILVVGGGPAGSYSAGLLAREGFEVVLLEADAHPRYHIGESLLPSMIPHLKFFGIENKIRTHGFIEKPGAACKFVRDQTEGYTDFVSESKLNGAWNVERADFDNICFRHAGELGAALFENTKVTSIEFEEGSDHKPISAAWKSKTGETGTIAFDYLVDASGRNGLMSNKYLKNRIMKDSLKNIAQWSYWAGAGCYMPGTSRENAPYFESLMDGSGWAWFIPLREKVSVGVVLHEQVNTVRRKAASSLEDHYMKLLDGAPNIRKLLGDAKRETEKVRQASDFSYSAADSAGPNFRIVGDAASFIDPLFSSGVHMAFVGGLSAAATIAASIRGDTDEHTAARYHDKKVATAYTRFLIVVLSVYRQIRRQDVHVLSDIDADNFQAAFDVIRPIIQGTSDSRGDVMSATALPVNDMEIQKTIEFCTEMLGGRGFKPDKEPPTAKYVKQAKYAQESAKYSAYVSSSEESDSAGPASSPATSVHEESSGSHDSKSGYDATVYKAGEVCAAKATPDKAGTEEKAASYPQEKSSPYPSEKSAKYATGYATSAVITEKSAKYGTPYKATEEKAATYPIEQSSKYTSGYEASKTGYDASKTGYEASKTGYDASKTGYEASKTGYDASKTGYEASKTGYDASKTGYEASKEASFQYPKESFTKYSTGYAASKAEKSTGYALANSEAKADEESAKYGATAYTTQASSASYPVKPYDASVYEAAKDVKVKPEKATKADCDGVQYPSNMYKTQNKTTAYSTVDKNIYEATKTADSEFAAAQSAARASVGKSMVDTEAEVLKSLQVTMEQFVKDSILGHTVRLQRGNLGLRKVA